MSSELHQMVYCSHAKLPGRDADLNSALLSILACARAKNRRHGVTGALLYHAGDFAQLLEGPQSAVESIYAAIERDPRHSHVTLASSCASSQRVFPAWAMAFGGNGARASIPLAAAAIEAVFARAPGAGEAMAAVLQEIIVRENDFHRYSSLLPLGTRQPG